jgi:paraquat-inducible protein B
MSKQASPAKVGAFVLVGAAIFVLTLGLLGTARLFSRPVPMIVYFRDSVNGLVVGSPVKYKGVTIGQVTDITLAFAEGNNGLVIPVLIEINEEEFETGQHRELPLIHPVRLQQAVDNGLRATLESESLVTGRLYVALDVFPKAGPPVYLGNGRYPEIPTESSGLVEFIKNLSKVDLPAMVNQLNEILTKLNTSLGELKVKDLNDRLARVLNSVDELLATSHLPETLESFRQTSDQAKIVLSTLEAEIKPIGTNLNRTAETATTTFVELQRAVTDLRRVLASESPVMSELQRALEETAFAARSLRSLADELSRDPAALLKGRYHEEKR